MCVRLTFRTFGSIKVKAMPADPIYRHIGLTIKERRKKLGLKQEALSGKLGISRGALANIETGRQSVLVHQLYRLARALELTPFDLLPQPESVVALVDRTELPLPPDLKKQQKQQIARLFAEVDTTHTRQKKGSRGKE
jgi:transcriptional regulator with XRE-family HTH domain